MTTIDITQLVSFTSGCAQLGIPAPSAERYLRQRPHCLPPVRRIGWQRFFLRSDLDRYAAERPQVDSHLQALAAVLELASAQRSRAA